ncbi:MAG: TolC family protein [Spirochaetales bacterium]|nr:TolC family protein [Spirochaetales bacterium]
MNTYCIILYILAFPLLAAPSRLEELLSDSVSSHVRIRALLHEVQAMRHNARLAVVTYPDPEIMVETMQGRARGSVIFPEVMPEAASMKGSSLRLAQPIPFPGKLSLKSSQARLRADQAEVALVMERNELARETLSALARYESIRIEQGLARSFVLRTQALAQAARTRYAGGKGTLADVASVQVRQARYQDQVLVLAGREKSELAELDYLVNAGPGLETWKNQVSGLAGYTDSLLERLTDSRLEDAPRVRLARLEQSVQEQGQKLARSEYLPDFSVFASLKKEEERLQGLRAGLMRDETYSVGLTVRVPLWTALSNHQNTRAAGETVRSAENRALDAIGRLKRDLAINEETLQSLKKRRSLFRSSLLPQARAARESALVSYETARGDFATLMNSWDMLYELEGEAARLEALYRELIFSRAAMLGVLLEVEP